MMALEFLFSLYLHPTLLPLCPSLSPALNKSQASESLPWALSATQTTLKGEGEILNKKLAVRPLTARARESHQGMYLKTGDLVKSSGGRVSMITEEPGQSYTTRKTEGRDSMGGQEGKPSEREGAEQAAAACLR